MRSIYPSPRSWTSSGSLVLREVTYTVTVWSLSWPFLVILVVGTGVRHFFLPPEDSPGVARSVATKILQTFRRLSNRQIKYVSLTWPSLTEDKAHLFRGLPSTDKVIAKYCAKNNLNHFVDPLSHDARLHWIGSFPAHNSKIDLWFHGGGYNFGATRNHINLGLKCASESDFTLAMLEYTLAPDGCFPIQLIQAVNALKHLLNFTLPSKIFIPGDSAGGHLALSLLSHTMHASKGIKPIVLSEELAGICFISPFLSFDYNKESYTSNAKRDYISLAQIQEFNANLKEPGLTDEEALKDPRLSHLDAPAGWWKNWPVEWIMLG